MIASCRGDVVDIVMMMMMIHFFFLTHTLSLSTFFFLPLIVRIQLSFLLLYNKIVFRIVRHYPRIKIDLNRTLYIVNNFVHEHSFTYVNVTTPITRFTNKSSRFAVIIPNVQRISHTCTIERFFLEADSHTGHAHLVSRILPHIHTTFPLPFCVIPSFFLSHTPKYATSLSYNFVH